MALTFSSEEKQSIRKMVMERFTNSGFSSQSKFAKSLGMVDADITNLFKEKYISNQQLIGIEKWVKFARFANFNKNPALAWNTASTVVYEFITNQLDACKESSMAAMLVDDAGIGKTHTAKYYSRNKPNTFYIDCSISTKKTEFVRAFAQAVGIGNTGKISDLLDASLYALSQMDRPLVILDEAGDLEQSALLIVKRIYNALEAQCGLYLMGADGLRTRINNGLSHKKLGFVELFSRFGKRFQTCLPTIKGEKLETLKEMALTIAIANGIEDRDALQNIQKCIAMNDGGLADMRRVTREIQKYKSNIHA